MSKSKNGPESEREREAEKRTHKLRREQKQREADLLRTIQDEDIDSLYDEDIPRFERIKTRKSN